MMEHNHTSEWMAEIRRNKVLSEIVKGAHVTDTNGEVVNVDSMQLYRGMDIGTAKVPLAEREGIPHHQLDVWEVTETASVARYQHDAIAAIGLHIVRRQQRVHKQAPSSSRPSYPRPAALQTAGPA